MSNVDIHYDLKSQNDLHCQDSNCKIPLNGFVQWELDKDEPISIIRVVSFSVKVTKRLKVRI